jgi:hypothetical protein
LKYVEETHLSVRAVSGPNSRSTAFSQPSTQAAGDRNPGSGFIGAKHYITYLSSEIDATFALLEDLILSDNADLHIRAMELTDTAGANGLCLTFTFSTTCGRASKLQHHKPTERALTLLRHISGDMIRMYAGTSLSIPCSLPSLPGNTPMHRGLLFAEGEEGLLGLLGHHIVLYFNNQSMFNAF